MKATFSIKPVPETLFGCDILESSMENIAKLGQGDILLVIDREMKNKGLTTRIERILNSHFNKLRKYIIEERVLSVQGVNEALQKVDPQSYDIVIGYGGWRCTDLAKILGVWARNPDPEIIFSTQTGQIEAIPIVSIPTTPPNGAEIDSKVLIRNKEKRELVSFDFPALVPRLLVIDPTLMKTIPPDLAASTGIDSLSHAIDSLISLESSPFTQILALQSLGLICENLVSAVKNPSNIGAMYNLAFGSLLSALALNMTGSGAIHALAYPLTARYGISHAQATSLICQYVIDYNIPVVPADFAKVARFLRCPVTGSESDAQLVSQAMKELFRTIQLPTHMSSYQIPGIDLNELTELASRYSDILARNPRVIDSESILKIYRKSL